jgi:RNA polymerase sigma-70 factor (ECF subfamily)
MSESRHELDRAARGDEAALHALLVRHLPSLHAYVRLKAGPLVRGKESIQDVVQSVCREVLADAGHFEYRGEAEFRHWLFTQALHKIHNKHRHFIAGRRAAAREVDAGEDGLALAYASVCSPSEHAMGREALATFEAAFARLPEDQREAVLLRRLVGLDYAAIAKHIGKSEGAARNLVYRGVARLAQLTQR